MNPFALYRYAVIPAAAMLPDLDSPEARVLLLAIAGQETGWVERRQIPDGQARSFWQMEKPGAVLDVLTSESTRGPAMQICSALAVPPGLDDVFEAIAWHDVLAACLARLALWLSPLPLPAIDDAPAAWAMYLAVWRPGKPRPETWAPRHAAAVAVVQGAAVA